MGDAGVIVRVNFEAPWAAQGTRREDKYAEPTMCPCALSCLRLRVCVDGSSSVSIPCGGVGGPADSEMPERVSALFVVRASGGFVKLDATSRVVYAAFVCSLRGMPIVRGDASSQFAPGPQPACLEPSAMRIFFHHAATIR